MIRKCSVHLLMMVAVASLSSALCVAQSRSPLIRQVRQETRDGRAQLVGRLPSDKSMHLVLALPLRNQAQLGQFLRDVHDPSSSSYRRYLTVKEFTEKFGPSQEDYDSVIKFARTHGLTVVSTSRNRINVEVEAPVSKVESAFHLTMGTYRHPTENRVFFAPDREPSIELPVQLWHIFGLDDYSIPKAALTRKQASASRLEAAPTDSFNPTGSGPGNYFLGSDMRAAYYGGTDLTGAGQSLGLFELNNGVNPSDLSTYFRNIGQTNNVPITQISTDGSPTSCSFNASTGACDDAEQVLDVTQAVGMAPGLSNLVIYVGGSDASVLNAMATANPLNAQLSCSWTWYPSDPSTDDPYFEEFEAQGQTFFAATGDRGAWAPWSSIFQSVFPAEDPYVTSVGGTDLQTESPGGAWSSEATWSQTGGGISPDEFAIPFWQVAAANGCADCSAVYRNGPDVAANASTSFFVCADQAGCPDVYGGTSFAAPMWAGYMALINEQSVANGSSTLGMVNPALYQIAQGQDYGSDFHDIMSGNNDCTGIAPGCYTTLWYSAAPGYDLVTGLGSPNGSALINALAPPSNAPRFTLLLSSTSAAVAPGDTVTSTITTTIANTFNSAVALSASGQPAGVGVSFSPSSISAPGSGASTMTVTVASSVPAGTYPISVAATGSGLIRTATFSLNVTGAGFTLSESITTAAISQGGSGLLFDSFITTAAIGNFNSEITLSAGGLPAGLSMSFSPATIAAPGNGQSHFTFTAAPSILPGTYPITLAGSADGITHTATFFLVVEGYDLYATDSPSVLTVSQGASVTSTVAVTPVNGFSDSVPLSVSGLPDGVTATFSPNPLVGGGGTSVLTLTASDTAAIGTAAVVVNVAAPYPPSAPPTILFTVVGANAPDFTLSASPVSLSVQQGNSVSTTISSSITNGFNSAIALSAGGWPADATVTFSASTIAAPGSGSATMTVSVPSCVPPGTYPMTVIGTGGGIQQGTSFFLTVTAAPADFTVSASPASVIVPQGGSGISTITTVAVDSLASGINLTATGVPAGMAVAFSPTSIAPPGSGTSTMTFTAVSNVTPGIYPITVTGTSRGAAASTTVSLIAASLPGPAQDFGQVNVGTTSVVMPILLFFNSSGTLGSTAVLTQGAAGLDFALASGGTCTANAAYTAGQSCVVNITFAPEFAGIRYGAAVLTDINGNILATGYFQGTGIAPQINFQPNTESTVASAGLLDPNGVAVDGSGNVYIADSANNRILKETLYGDSFTESVIPTSPLSYPYGLTVDAGGNVYIADTNNFRILKESPSGGSYVESVVAGFSPDDSVFPMGVAVDGKGNVYFSCSSGALYVETLVEGIYVQSTVPTGTSSLAGLAVDQNGNVYLADNANVAILKETPSDGGYVLSTLPIGNGIAVPAGIALDGRGNIFISDDAGVVWKETPAGDGYVQSAITTSPLDLPFGLAVDGPGNLYIADAFDFRVLKEEFANPPALNFTDTVIGTTSSDSPQTISIENVGNAALTFSVHPNIAPNFTLNSGGESPCPLLSTSSSQPGKLAAGASCRLSVSFSPAALGSLSGSLTLSDNNLNAAAPNYATQTIAVSGTSVKVTPVITWNTPASITYGTRLSAVQLNATSNVSGTFTYSPKSGTLLTAGSQLLTVTFTPKNSNEYATTTATVTLIVDQATPTIKWATPAPITYGTPLSTKQLDATSTVAGTLTYSPVAGTVLDVGSQTLSALFTPTDTVDYTTAASSVVLIVNPAPTFTLSASPASLSVSRGGGSGQITLAVTDVNGFTGNVSLSASGLPNGVTAAFSKNPTGGTSVLTLKASKQATTGAATITIMGTSGSLIETATIDITVN